MKRSWSAKSVAGRMRHGIFHLLIRLGGVRAGYALLAPVVLWYTCLPRMRRRSMFYLARRFPAAGRFALFVHCFRLYFCFGKVLVDGAHAAHRPTLMEVAPEDIRTLTDLATEGKGVVVLTTHAGCWQQALGILSRHLPGRVAAVMHKDPEDYSRAAQAEEKQGIPLTVIDPAEGPGAALRMTHELTEGGIVGIMGDRLFHQAEAATSVSFLGQEARFPYAAFHLASTVGVPLAVVFARRTGPCHGALSLVRVLHLPPGLGKRPEAYREYVADYVALLEAYVAENPYQFFNFYNLWEQ